MVGELNYFLRLQVKQQEDGIFISQEKYTKNLVKRFGLDSKKHISIPMSSSAKLSLDAASVEVDPTLYRSMIGSLLYLTASRLDITFNLGVCARFQAAPKESHLTVVKRIIRYINGTFDYGIWCIDDRKNTSGGCFYLGNNLVSWMSKKQNSVSLSMVEAEYIAAMSPTKRTLLPRNPLSILARTLTTSSPLRQTWLMTIAANEP
ncbi:uncharacterized mitochondrial protein AtMg00810-like [Quercus suber]|uniref:uncharacterized mitochondrial protein AtMg00810-like n=1 Tax=Quercus suber TaxID=58331 RepID=UPI0032DE411C